MWERPRRDFGETVRRRDGETLERRWRDFGDMSERRRIDVGGTCLPRRAPSSARGMSERLRRDIGQKFERRQKDVFTAASAIVGQGAAGEILKKRLQMFPFDLLQTVMVQFLRLSVSLCIRASWSRFLPAVSKDGDDIVFSLFASPPIRIFGSSAEGAAESAASALTKTDLLPPPSPPHKASAS
ncbi:hypothetical protein EYF80_033693 [Liparis tanakae]|uniref:Uncharacterized protein n=1 Tax=Liparis tanakae TaxID=230148 RepID=A0A4Z2GTL1_9TELE|nr:hypothetical protein EYF80_033693 [Liparis tanakae]